MNELSWQNDRDAGAMVEDLLCTHLVVCPNNTRLYSCQISCLLDWFVPENVGLVECRCSHNIIHNFLLLNSVCFDWLFSSQCR